MEESEGIREKLALFFEDRKRLPLAFIIILTLFTLIGIAGFGGYVLFHPGTQEAPPPVQQPVMPDQPLLLTPYEPFPDDFYLNRPRGSRLSEGELERWFSNPDGKLMDELHAANKAAVQNLLEAAP